MLVPAVQLSEPAICIHISPLSWALFYMFLSFWKRMFLSFNSLSIPNAFDMLSSPLETAPSWRLWPLPLGVLLSGAVSLPPPIILVMACANTQAFFSVCIPQRTLPAQASSATSALRRSKMVAFSTTFLSPELQSHLSSQLSTRHFHHTLSWLLPPICQVQETVFLPSVLRSASSLTFNFPLSHPDLSYASWTGLSPYPQIQAQSCARVYFKMSLPLVSPSGFCLPPSLPAPLTSPPLSPSSVSSPHPSILSIPLHFLEHHGICFLAWVSSVPPYILLQSGFSRTRLKGVVSFSLSWSF